jgi:hypothetical protein
LFGFIASELAKFVADEDKGNSFSKRKKRELGFTFSFPVWQHSIASGSLVKWTKAFCIEDAVRIPCAHKSSIFICYVMYANNKALQSLHFHKPIMDLKSSNYIRNYVC